MNKVRRKALTAITESLENLKGELEELRDEEQEYLDNMPESLQSSEKYYAAENATTTMDEGINNFCDVVDSINEVIES